MPAALCWWAKKIIMVVVVVVVVVIATHSSQWTMFYVLHSKHVVSFCALGGFAPDPHRGSIPEPRWGLPSTKPPNLLTSEKKSYGRPCTRKYT